ncbi:MAG TPA: hypothetical protein VNS19_22650 [Acidimicrobiales bacterium]|jgi:hypothetical protein|nr:hypothetical protein [Acidimicrobiales bacterium]
MGRNDKGPAVHDARAAVLAQRKRRRNLLILALVLAIGLTQAANAWSSRDDGTEEVSSAAPGYAGGDRPIDTSPFQLATPDNTAPTTSPVDFNDPLVTTTSAPPTTSPAMTLPPGASDSRADPVCGAIGKMYDLNRDSGQLEQDPERFAEVSTKRLMEAADLVESTNDPRYAAAVDVFRTAATQVAAATDVESIAAVLRPLLLAQTPEIAAASAPLSQHAQTTCPGFLALHEG